MTAPHAFATANTIRTLFSRAMSEMYQQEVPQYGTLIELVENVNQRTLQSDPALKNELEKSDNLARLSEERHGAIRLGKAEELKTMAELFAVMGMHPVNYYDLTVADIPVHSTAFRPIDDDALKENPFRVFTSLLRTDLIQDHAIRTEAEKILANRDIFTPKLRELLEIYKQQHQQLTLDQAHLFVSEALETFRWHKQATISKEAYERFHHVHRLTADVVSFQGPHINHLTPRTLDIDLVQHEMPSRGIHPKAVIEGPPRRNVPILLRQTSFKALEEPIMFTQADGASETGAHTARFGEIEQRGAALTPKGQALYDQLLNETRTHVTPAADGSNADAYYAALEKTFEAFPDHLESLRQEALLYVSYRPTEKGLNAKGTIAETSIDALISQNYVEYSIITYEDFLPVSAAGIFTSNLGDDASQTIAATPNQHAFEKALGRNITDGFEIYQAKQEASLKATLEALAISA